MHVASRCHTLFGGPHINAPSVTVYGPEKSCTTPSLSVTPTCPIVGANRLMHGRVVHTTLSGVVPRSVVEVMQCLRRRCMKQVQGEALSAPDSQDCAQSIWSLWLIVWESEEDGANLYSAAAFGKTQFAVLRN